MDGPAGDEHWWGQRLAAHLPSDAVWARHMAAGCHGSADGSGTYIWPITRSAVAATDALLPPKPACIVELGCGRAYWGIAAALLRPMAQVLLTDGDPAVIAALNEAALPPLVSATALQWESPAPSLTACVEVVLGGDICYRRDSLPSLAHCLAQLLAPNGRAYLADPGNAPPVGSLAAWHDAGLRVRTRHATAGGWVTELSAACGG
jgi:SAM-dependent methyltransferase